METQSSLLPLLLISCVALGACEQISGSLNKSNTHGGHSKNPGHKDKSDIDSKFDEINNFKVPVPEQLCGQSGYQFLLQNYFQAHCGACHGLNGFVEPYFAVPNPEEAYLEALKLAPDTLLETSVANEFCGEECTLAEDGEKYQAIQEWLNNRFRECD